MVESILDSRDAANTFAGGDVIAWYAPPVTPPPTPFTVLTSPWLCLGWLETSGVTFKLNETMKAVNAAGTLDPIRTITTGAEKTFEATFLESMNPCVRSLYDDVPLASVLPTSGTTATWTFPEIPTDLRYAFIFAAYDNDKIIWDYAPNGKVTSRGNDQAQMSDVTSLQMTITLYPDTIGSVRAALQRSVQYGTSSDLTPYTS
jgi:hypothetical protein